MGLLSFFRKKPNSFFSEAEQDSIVSVIREAERATSGEIRIFVESKNPMMDVMDRAKEIFANLGMEKTEHRNAVLLYIATKDHELALYADEGIYNRVGASFWNDAVKDILRQMKGDHIAAGVELGVYRIGQTLKREFPYEKTTDKNELPDNIIFGK